MLSKETIPEGNGGYKYTCATCGTWIILPRLPTGDPPPPLAWLHDEKGHHIEALSSQRSEAVQAE